jgi:uncharacterized membrane protein
MDMYARIRSLLPLLIGVVFLVAVLTIAVMTFPTMSHYDNDEVTSVRYDLARHMARDDARLRVLARKYLADGKLTNKEYRRLCELEDQFEINDARAALQEALRDKEEE